MGVADVSFVEDGEYQSHDVAVIFSIQPAIISAERTVVSDALDGLLIEDEVADVLLERGEFLLTSRFPPSVAILA